MTLSIRYPIQLFDFMINNITAIAEIVIPMTAKIYTFIVVVSPKIHFAVQFITVGEISCPKQLPQVITAAAIVVDAGFTALDTSTIAVGINIPCENPQNIAPIISMIKLDGNRIKIKPPTLKDSIAAGSVYFFVILVIPPRINPTTI